MAIMIDYTISIYGCDDSTVFSMSLNADELLVINKFIEICNKTSTYGCQPKIRIKEGVITEENEDTFWPDEWDFLKEENLNDSDR